MVPNESWCLLLTDRDKKNNWLLFDHVEAKKLSKCYLWDTLYISIYPSSLSIYLCIYLVCISLCTVCPKGVYRLIHGAFKSNHTINTLNTLYLSIRLSIYLSIYLLVYLSIYLSIFVHMSVIYYLSLPLHW